MLDEKYEAWINEQRQVQQTKPFAHPLNFISNKEDFIFVLTTFALGFACGILMTIAYFGLRGWF